MSDEAKKPRWLVITLSLVPVWLAVSAGVAVWWSFQSDDKEEEERNQRFAMEMSVERIAEDMRKLTEVIGPRDKDNPEALMRAAAMIDGTLGPSNTGYQIQRIPGPGEAPFIRASLEQSKNDGRSIWLMASYDTTSSGKPGSESLRGDSSSVAALMAIAQAMAKDDLPTDIHFILLPHRYEDPFNTEKLAIKTLINIMEPPAMVICLGNIGGNNKLIANTSKESVTSESIVPPPINSSSFNGLSIIHNNADFFGHHLPQHVHYNGQIQNVIEFRSDYGATTENEAENIAINTGKIVEWLRRAARLEAQD